MIAVTKIILRIVTYFLFCFLLVIFLTLLFTYLFDLIICVVNNFNLAQPTSFGSILASVFGTIVFVFSIIFTAIVAEKFSPPKASEIFFGFGNEQPLNIYVSSGNQAGSKEGIMVKGESRAAIKLINQLDQIVPGQSFLDRLISWLNRMSNIEPRSYPRPQFDASPLGETKFYPKSSTILIGGPCNNSFTRALQCAGQLRYEFKFECIDPEKGRWVIVRDKLFELFFNVNISSKEKYYTDREEQNTRISSNKGIIEKILIEDQIVFVVHGHTELAVIRAVEYLGNNWKNLYKTYGAKVFTVLV